MVCCSILFEILTTPFKILSFLNSELIQEYSSNIWDMGFLISHNIRDHCDECHSHTFVHIVKPQQFQDYNS